MLLGDLIYDNDIDTNCVIEVYDCTDPNVQPNNQAPLIYTNKDNYHKPLDKVLDMTVTYITVINNKLIIEVTKRKD